MPKVRLREAGVQFLGGFPTTGGHIGFDSPRNGFKKVLIRDFNRDIKFNQVRIVKDYSLKLKIKRSLQLMLIRI